jgi:hypothetical protein
MFNKLINYILNIKIYDNSTKTLMLFYKSFNYTVIVNPLKVLQYFYALDTVSSAKYDKLLKFFMDKDFKKFWGYARYINYQLPTYFRLNLNMSGYYYKENCSYYANGKNLNNVGLVVHTYSKHFQTKFTGSHGTVYEAQSIKFKFLFKPDCYAPKNLRLRDL